MFRSYYFSVKENKYYSGNYMIKELRHTFSQPTRSHIISMMVVRDSLSDELKSTSVLTQTDTQTNTEQQTKQTSNKKRFD